MAGISSETHFNISVERAARGGRKAEAFAAMKSEALYRPWRVRSLRVVRSGRYFAIACAEWRGVGCQGYLVVRARTKVCLEGFRQDDSLAKSALDNRDSNSEIESTSID